MKKLLVFTLLTVTLAACKKDDYRDDVVGTYIGPVFTPQSVYNTSVQIEKSNIDMRDITFMFHLPDSSTWFEQYTLNADKTFESGYFKGDSLVFTIDTTSYKLVKFKDE